MPRKPRNVTVTDRDRFVLRALAKARVLRTSDIFALGVFPSLPTTRRRLRILLDARLISCHVVALAQDNRWVLDKAGNVVALGGEGLRKRRAFRDPGTHHFMLVRLWALLVRESVRRENVALIRFRFEWELSTPHLDTHTPHRPDAIARIQFGARTANFFIEVDTGTESPSYVAAHKMPIVLRMASAGVGIDGVVPERVLFVAPKDRRLRALAKADTTGASMFVGAAMSDRDLDLDFSQWRPLAGFLPQPDLQGAA